MISGHRSFLLSASLIGRGEGGGGSRIVLPRQPISFLLVVVPGNDTSGNSVVSISLTAMLYLSLRVRVVEVQGTQGWIVASLRTI